MDKNYFTNSQLKRKHDKDLDAKKSIYGILSDIQEIGDSVPGQPELNMESVDLDAEEIKVVDKDGEEVEPIPGELEEGASLQDPESEEDSESLSALKINYQLRQYNERGEFHKNGTKKEVKTKYKNNFITPIWQIYYWISTNKPGKTVVTYLANGKRKEEYYPHYDWVYMREDYHF